MKLIVFAVLLLTSLAHADLSVNTDFIRMTPTTLPTPCTTGDIRFNSATNELSFCALNVWTNLGTELATDWTSTNSTTINGGGNYSALTVNPAAAAGSADIGPSDTNDTITTPIPFYVQGANIINASSTHTAGDLNLYSGTTLGSGDAGFLGIFGGTAWGTGQGGEIDIDSGFSANGSSGNINLFTAVGNGNTTSGNIHIQTGDPSNAGTPGNITIQAGTGPGGSAGKIKLVDSSIGTSGKPWVSTDTVGSGHWATLGITGGGTGVTSVTTNPGFPSAATWAGWDANVDFYANGWIYGNTSITSAAGTSNISVSTAGLIYVTGSTTQTLNLPVVTTTTNGQRWRIVNLSSGNVTVQTSGGNTAQVMTQNTILDATVYDKTAGTGTASWNFKYTSLDTTNASNIASGTISSSRLPSPLLISNGSVSAPALAFSGDTNNGLYYIGTDNWGLSVGGGEALDLKVSSGGFGNVGIGGAASTSDAFPLLINRTTVGGTSQFQVTNGDTTAGAGTKMQVFADAGNNQMEVSAFSALTTSPDIYNGGRGIVRAAGSLAGMTLVADKNSGADIKLYAGGDAAANRIATVSSSGLTLGVAGTLTGALNLTGVTSGTVTVKTQSAAGTYEFDLPTTAGTSGYALTSAGGAGSPMTWTAIVTNPSSAAYDTVYQNAGNTALTNLANGTTGQYYKATSSAAPSWASFTSHSVTTKTSTGSGTGLLFTISAPASNVNAGCVFSNNGFNHTVIHTITSSDTSLFMSGAGATSGSTLTYVSGSTCNGGANLTFSATSNLGSYTPPSTAKALWVRMVGGGGAGGGAGATGASTAAAGAGGGGGGYVEKLITAFDSTIYFAVGTGGTQGSAGNNAGNGGLQTSFVDSQNLLTATGGSGGGGGPAQSGMAVEQNTGAAGGAGAGGDITVSGQGGNFSIVYSGTIAAAGVGGSSMLGLGGRATLVGAGGLSGGSQGTGYGSGGSGGAGQNAAAQTGALGNAGVVIIHELFNGN